MTTAAVLLAVLLGYTPTKGFVNLFSEGEYHCPDKNRIHDTFRYRLFIPRKLNPRKRYPLIVWLHGMNEGGRDNRNNVKLLEGMLGDLAHIDKYRFYILVAQCPSRRHHWMSSLSKTPEPTREPNDMLAVLHEIMTQVMSEHPVDENRVYLAGISSGGRACWEMAFRHPRLFAAMVVLSGGGADVSRLKSLKHLPIWLFHNRDDKLIPPDGDMHTAEAMRRIGGIIHLTLLEGTSHVSTIREFQRDKITAWLLAQRRGAWFCRTPPGCAP